MEEALDKLDVSKPRAKRQNDYEYLNDEVAEASNDAQANFDVKTSLKNVEVPMKGGSPAFSIHADKVYILYPSLFQDPNIFGRFSIPQTINLDPVPDKSVSKGNGLSNNVDSNLPPNQQSMGFGEKGKRVNKRQATEPTLTQRPPSKKEADKKRNVETHLTGTIVVLNQDVNEINRKDSY